MDNLWLVDEIPHPKPLFRFDEYGDRKYAAIRSDNTVAWMPSVTAIIRATSPMAPGLLKWYTENGMEAATAMRDAAAERGTEMHIIFAKYLASIPQDTEVMPEFHAKALWSFQQWIEDWQVKPLAVEVLLHDAECTFAGTVDLVCKLTDPKSGEVFTAIVDFKSGTSSYRDHAVQLEFYRMAWNDTVIGSMTEGVALEQWGDTKYITHYTVSRVFNWHPKDWRKSPTYTFKEQTGEIDAEEVRQRCSLYHMSNDVTPKATRRFVGMMPGNASIETIEPDDIVRQAHARLTQPPIDQVDPTAWAWENPHDR